MPPTPLEMILLILSFVDTPTLHRLIHKWPRDLHRLLRKGHVWFVLSTRGLDRPWTQMNQVLAVVPRNRILALTTPSLEHDGGGYDRLWKLDTLASWRNLPLPPSVRHVQGIREMIGLNQTIPRVTTIEIYVITEDYYNTITAPDAEHVRIHSRGQRVMVSGDAFPKAKTITVRMEGSWRRHGERRYASVFRAPCLERLQVIANACAVEASGGNCPRLKEVSARGRGIRGRSSRDKGSVDHLSVVLQ